MVEPEILNEKPRIELYLGDCLEIMKQISDKSIDLILTDPPYNTGMKATNGKAWLCHFFNDDFMPEVYNNLVVNSTKEIFRVLKDNKAIYVFMSIKQIGLWLETLAREGFTIKNVIVWDKMVHGLNYQNYAYTYELIIYAIKGDFKVQNKTPQDIQKKYYTDVWHIQRKIDTINDGDHHETVKHPSVIKIPLLHSTNQSDTILDPFMGSGTTLVAAKELGRNAIGIEIEPKYYEIAKRRINNAITEFL